MAAPCGHAFRVVKNILEKIRSVGPTTTLLHHRRCLSVSSRKLHSYEEQQRKETHFGFESVPEEEKEGKVYEVFENVADKYDLMNDAMSVGVHRVWKDCFVSRLGPVLGTKLIDVAGGTGDIAFRCLDYCRDEHGFSDVYKDKCSIEQHQSIYPAEEQTSDSQQTQNESQNSSLHTHVTVCDINQNMLDVGKKKAEERGFQEGRDVSWLCGNAECLPLGDNTFDGYTIAFGIRNVTHIEKVLEEAHRVLKPGGRFMCLEFSRVNNPVLRSLYDSYSFQVIPVLGQVIARDWKSYQYLVESIRQFPDQETFAEMIREAGFGMVTYENLTFGVAAIHSGFKMR